MVDGVKRMDVAEGAEAAPSSDLVFSMQRPRRFLLTRVGCGRGCDIKRRFHIPTSLYEEQLRLLGGQLCRIRFGITEMFQMWRRNHSHSIVPGGLLVTS